MPTLAEVQQQLDAQAREKLSRTDQPGPANPDAPTLTIRPSRKGAGGLSFDRGELLRDLKRHEGLRLKAYKDTRGKLTIGYGHNLDARGLELFPDLEVSEDLEITPEQADALLAADVGETIERLQKRFPEYNTLPGAQQQALANMAYQMGSRGVMKFENMIGALKEGDWKRAEAEAKNSQWARRHKRRARDVSRMMGMAPDLVPKQKPRLAPRATNEVIDRQHGRTMLYDGETLVGARPLTPVEKEVREAQDELGDFPVTGVLRQGPLPSLREQTGLGEVSAFDIMPITGTALALDDVNKMLEKERVGIDVGMFESTFTYAAVPLSVAGELTALRRLKTVGAKLDRMWDRLAAKFADMAPLGRLPDQEAFLKERYKALGRISNVDDLAQRINDLFRGASKNDQRAIYDYLTTAPEGMRKVNNDGTFIEAGPLDTEQLIKETAIGELDDVTLARKAQKVKGMILNVGQELVKRGILSEEAFRAHAGSYLPRIYLKHLLDKPEWRGIGGNKLSERAYVRARKDIPKEVRDIILGEITNPGYLAGRAISLPGHDIAVFDYLRRIMRNPNWVLPNSVVNYRGKYVTPQFLKNEAERLRRQAQHAETPTIAGKMEAEASRMDSLADPVLDSLQQDYKNFRQLPDSARYGELRGMWVRKEIYSDLVGAGRFGEPDSWAEAILGSGARKAHQIWKLGKTALNPPTQVRNFISNGVLLQLSGVPMHRLPDRVIEAISSIAKNGEAWKIAKDYGVKKTTFANAELIRMQEGMLEAMKQSNNPMDQLRRIAGIVGNFSGDVYQLSESIFKTAKIIDETARGVPSEQAALEAHKWLFDYSLVPSAVRELRTNPFLGAPFLTFYYKAAPRMLETAVKNPQRYLPYLLAGYGMKQWFKETHDVSSSELESLKQTLPEFLRNKQSLYVLPYRDENGQWQYMDVGYFFPWQTFTEGTKALGGLPEAEFGALTEVTGILGTPITQAVTGLSANKDPFTGKEIWNEADPPADQIADMMGFMWSLAMPSWLSGSGAVSKMHEAVTQDTDRFGNPPPTVSQAALRFLGVNIYSIDPELSRAINIRKGLKNIQEIQSRMAELMMDQTLSPEDQRWIQEKYTSIIRKQMDELRQYEEDSSFPSKLRAKPE